MLDLQLGAGEKHLGGECDPRGRGALGDLGAEGLWDLVAEVLCPGGQCRAANQSSRS